MPQQAGMPGAPSNDPMMVQTGHWLGPVPSDAKTAGTGDPGSLAPFLGGALGNYQGPQPMQGAGPGGPMQAAPGAQTGPLSTAPRSPAANQQAQQIMQQMFAARMRGKMAPGPVFR